MYFDTPVCSCLLMGGMELGLGTQYVLVGVTEVAFARMALAHRNV